MTPTASTFKVLNHPSLDNVSGSQRVSDASHSITLVESAELLKGSKAVGIVHNGSLYRLQATKLGKLILTK